MYDVVYVAYKKYFSGDVIILGVYSSPDLAQARCDEAEEDVNCAYAEWESFSIV